MGRNGFRRPQRQYSPIGLNVRHRRVELGLTQQELANRSGLAIPHINMIEGGERRNLRAETLRRLASALDWSIDELTALSPAPRAESVEVEALPEALNRFLASPAAEDVTEEELKRLRGAEALLGFPPTPGTYVRLLDLLRSHRRENGR